MTEDSRPDDVSILNTDRLLRRITRNQLRFENGVWRPTSAAFKALEMSVNIESLMIAQGREPEDTLVGYPNEYLTALVAGRVRSHAGLRIVKDLGPGHDPAHGLVLGKKRDSFANAMVREHQWIVEPPAPEEPLPPA
jgi:hypothetical protein